MRYVFNVRERMMVSLINGQLDNIFIRYMRINRPSAAGFHNLKAIVVILQALLHPHISADIAYSYTCILICYELTMMPVGYPKSLLHFEALKKKM